MTLPLRERLTQPVPAWRVAVVALVVGAVAAFAGFATGRLNALEETSEQVAVITREREKVVERWHKGKDRIVYSETVRAPDGTVTEKRSERETSKEEGGRELEREAERSEESKRTTVSRARYSFGLGVGYSIREPALKLGDTNLVIDASAGVRLGDLPLFLEGRGNTAGVFILGARGEF